MKTCTKCKARKPSIEFNLDAKCPDGRRAQCKACCKAARELRKNRKKETDAIRYADRAHEFRGYASAYRKENRPRKNAYDAYRYMLRNLATPKWASKKRIAAFYKAARRRSAETGQLWHVDHVIPLKSKIVCGLHVESNLQIITASENQHKATTLLAGV